MKGGVYESNISNLNYGTPRQDRQAMISERKMADPPSCFEIEPASLGIYLQRCR
jgi:hypothetical protein